MPWKRQAGGSPSSPDILVDLDATSPLRLPSDIVGAVELLQSSGASSVITGSRSRRSPYFNLVEERPDGTVGLSKPLAVSGRAPPGCAAQLRHERLDLCLARRSVSANSPRFSIRTRRLFEMPEERSIDIDSDLDFRIVELLFGDRQGQREAKP